MEAASVTTNKRMDNESVIHIHKGTLFNCKNRNYKIWGKVDWSGNYTKWYSHKGKCHIF